MNIPFVDLRAQLATIREDIFRNLQQAVEGTDFILGEEVERFEREFASYCGSTHAIGVNSGLDALRLSLMALGIGPGDEVIIPANTFIACALAITDVGGLPVLVEPDEKTYVLDAALVAARMTSRTKAIMPVHLYGHPVEMESINDLARRHCVWVVEDASQAHGAMNRGRRVGSLGHLAAFSLYPGKNLGAYGDAGIITTDQPEWADRIRLLRNYGSSRKYFHDLRGCNSRLDTLQAAVLTAKLPHLDAWNDQRRVAAARYTRLLAGVGDIVTPAVREGATHAFHLYVIRSRHRNALADFLRHRGVTTIIHYPVPIHRQEAYRPMGLWRDGDFPLTERLCDEILSLPIYPGITTSQIDYVADCIQSFFKESPDEEK